MDWFLIIATLVKILLVISILLLSVSMLVLAERKVAAWTQNRLGPNRVGPGGLLQPFADVFKLLVKEDIVPVVANRFIHALAPMLALFVAFTTYAVIPPGPSIEIFGRTVDLVIADVDGYPVCVGTYVHWCLCHYFFWVVIRQQVFFAGRYPFFGSDDFV